METQQHYRPSDALADVQATRESVKERGRSPFLAWLLLALAVGFSVTAVSGGGWLAPFACVVVVVVAIAVAVWHRRTSGITYSARSIGGGGVLVAVGYTLALLALYFAAVVVHFDRHPQWWGLVLGAAGVGVTLFLGRVMENAWARRAAPTTTQVAA